LVFLQEADVDETQENALPTTPVRIDKGKNNILALHRLAPLWISEGIRSATSAILPFV
jgi:hypothetical protein